VALKWLDRLAAALAFLGGSTVILLVTVTVVSVIWRYILSDPIFGVTDVSRMVLAVIIAGALPYGSRMGAFVHVDILSAVGGRRITRFTDVFVRISGIIIIGLATYSLREEARCGFHCGEFTDNLEIIHTPFYWLLAASMATYTAILVCELFAGILAFGSDNDPNEHN